MLWTHDIAKQFFSGFKNNNGSFFCSVVSPKNECCLKSSTRIYRYISVSCLA